MNHKLFNPLLLALCLLFSVSSYAQDYNYVEEEKKEKEEEKPKEVKQEDPENEQVPFKERIYFGGNVGFQFGNITFIDISPLAAYKVTEELHLGAGVSYQYFKDSRFVNDFSSTIVGGRVFGRYFVTEQVFPHVELESLSFKFQDAFGRELDRQWYTSVLAGIGIAQPIGRRGALNALVLYNLSWRNDRTSLYSSPWVTRVGFTF